MTSFLNKQRPPVFCPGCSHERVVRELDDALQALGLKGNQVAIVTDIGCSGLFDTFFNTHALHGLHGRALTYATGLKMARPDLTVITIMGDGGLGIGGAHVLSSCRRNLDINLLVLNNFNYGMTGGQCSVTTPATASTSSGFLNQLEPPLDICRVGAAAGAPWVQRIMATSSKLSGKIQEAIAAPGFSLMDIWGVCPGRYSKRNTGSLKQIAGDMSLLPAASGPVPGNERSEFGSHYRSISTELPPASPVAVIDTCFTSPVSGRRDILLLGGAGQRINTAGEVLCLSAMSAGLHVTQKNDYPITVLRGHSISEVVLSRSPVGYTGIDTPHVIIALSGEGVMRRKLVFPKLTEDSLVIMVKGMEIPPHCARTIEIDFKPLRIPSPHWALASLAILAREHSILTEEMLQAGLSHRFSGKQLDESSELINRCFTSS
jgi:2-oxoglutarate ferredoxin oxidoreductase subunit beta